MKLVLEKSNLESMEAGQPGSWGISPEANAIICVEHGDNDS